MTNPSPQPKPIHHRVMFSDLAGCHPPQLITIEGPEAQHLARVKRARVGEMVGVLDGRGAMGLGEIAEITGSKQRPMIAIMLDRVEMVDPVSPRIQICCPAPKGDRLERMIDQLTQIGVESWIPLISDRSERDPNAIRQDRIERIINEASKQCIRARSLVLHEPMTLTQAMTPVDSMQMFACDGSGESSLGPIETGCARVFIGPEGGWTDNELASFTGASIPVLRIGAHVLRLETAAVVAGSLAIANAKSPNPFGED